MAQIYAFRYAYDAAGNRTKEYKDGTSVYYYYDAANQLTQKEEVGTGRPCGTEGFVERIGRLIGRLLLRKKPGPKPRSRKGKLGGR